MEINLARIKKKVQLHYREACILKQDSLLTMVLITEGLCPGKSSKRWKQRRNLFRCLANELWSVELWLTMRVNGQIMLQEVTGHFGVSFFSLQSPSLEGPRTYALNCRVLSLLTL